MRLPRGSRPLSSSQRTLLVVALLAVAVWWGRTRPGPSLEPSLARLFPDAQTIGGAPGGSLHVARDAQGKPVGWAARGEAAGFAGPLVLVVGIGPGGRVLGAEVVQHRETPIFFVRAKAAEYLRSLRGQRVDEIDYEGWVDVVSGATLSTRALAASTRQAGALLARERLGAELPVGTQPWDVGAFELALLLLFGLGVASPRLSPRLRERLRWPTQIAALLIVGFWEGSPVTLAKLSALLLGSFPDPRSSLALYLLLGGFLLTLLLLGRSVYCSHVCPFGAAQRLVNLIGGQRLSLPPWSMRLMSASRDVVVLAAAAAALATTQPARASYEPFAALFVLEGTLLQWVLLLVILIASLVLWRPWCHFFCPMRSCERLLLETRRMGLQAARRGPSASR